MVPTKFDKNKIASLVNFVMPLNSQQGFFFSPILFNLFSDALRNHSLMRSWAGLGWYRQQLPLLCSSGCCFCTVVMQVYCSKCTADEQRTNICLCFLTFSRGNRKALNGGLNKDCWSLFESHRNWDTGS